MRWFICTLSKEGFHNWELCKEVGLWGVPTNGKKIAKPDLTQGDGLFVYAASRGIKAICEIIGEARMPRGKDEAPWAGGIFRYGLVFPIKVIKEFEEAISGSFFDQKLEGTSISTSQLRRGFAPVTAKDGQNLFKLLSDK